MNGEREVRTGSDLAAPTQASGVPASFAPGARIRQYEIIRPLGQGGMGIVYLARDVHLGRRVAIKVLVTQSPTLTRDFLREARATASCEHDNIVVIHEADEHEELYFVTAGRARFELAGEQKDAPAGTFVCRSLLLPHPASEPSDLSARLCAFPAATATKSLPAGTFVSP